MKKKTSLKRIFVFCFILILMVVSFPLSVSADLEDQLEDLENQIENSKDNAEAQEELADLLLQQLANLDQQISETTALIVDYKEQKIQVEANLEQAKIELEEATANRTYYQKLLEERLTVMYMYGDTGYIDVLFGSESFSDFIGRLEVVTSIMSYDREILGKLEETEAVIEAKKIEIEEENSKLATLIKDLSKEEANLESQRSAKDGKLSEIEDNITYWNALADQQEKEAEELRRLIAASNATGDYGNDFNSRFLWPVPGHTYISDYFGYRVHPISGSYRMHYGIDIPAPYNTEMVAVANGKVIYAQYKYSFGNTVIIELGADENGHQYKVLYAHANKILVNVGDIVTAGQAVALVGSTGDSTGPHVHFSVYVDGVYKNPLNYINRY